MLLHKLDTLLAVSLPSICRAAAMQISISSTSSPSTKFCMSHPRSNHAPCTRKLYQLIPRRRHPPVPHSGINRGSHSGYAHGHIPAARPSNVKGITAPGRSPKARDTRQYEETKTDHQHKPWTAAACVSPESSAPDATP